MHSGFFVDVFSSKKYSVSLRRANRNREKNRGVTLGPAENNRCYFNKRLNKHKREHKAQFESGCGTMSGFDKSAWHNQLLAECFSHFRAFVKTN